MKTDILTKYRPKTFDDVVGQKKVISSLKQALKDKVAHSFIFHGPSGTGKTTLARIVASQVGCTPENLKEVDAATYTGIDPMRELSQGLIFFGLGHPTKVVIVDEAHALSKAAWQSLLKVVEEPPPHVYWCFCTTEYQKIPDTIMTRCLSYQLDLCSVDDVYELLNRITDAERMKVQEDVLYLVAETCDGSPRQALSRLCLVYGCEDRKQAAQLLRHATIDDGDAITLCKALLAGTTWEKAMCIVNAFEGTNPESVRIVIASYLTAVARKTKGERQVVAVLRILEAFADPYPSHVTSPAHLLLSIGEVLLNK